MIHLVDVDIFTLKVDAIVNPINSDGVMGKGLALQFKKLYPEMFKKYQTLCIQGKLDIGKLFVYTDSQDYKYIVNLPTKKQWRLASKLHYIDEGLYKLAKFISEKQVMSIAIPALGCGCGQLKWEDVYACIQRRLSPLVACHIYVCLPNKFISE